MYTMMHERHADRQRRSYAGAALGREIAVERHHSVKDATYAATP